jgi:HSP20 family protein
MRRLFDDLNNIGMMPRFDTFDLPQMAKFQKTMWAPQIEVMEKKGEFVLKADLPGLHREDIDVEFTENALVISGERNQETTKEDEGFYQTERNYGSFFRSIPLPEGFDADKAKAVFHNGVLEVSIPMPKKEKKTRKLPVGEKAAKAHAKAA